MRAGFLLILAFAAGLAGAAEEEASDGPAPDTVLFSRGEASVTVRDFKAALLQIPDEYRLQAANDPRVAKRLLSQLLENRLLAREARESGVADDPMTRAAVRAATEKVLAQRQLERVIAERDDADLGAMARDYYRAHPEEFERPPLLTVRHVLVATEDRGDEAALERAVQVRKQALAGTPFKELVAEYSDDEASKADAGLYEAVSADKLVEPFARAARALEPGAISDPVKTRYGYHVIKLIGQEERGQKPFDSVRRELKERFAEKQRKRVREAYLRELLDANPLDHDPEAIEALMRQYEAGPDDDGDNRAPGSDAKPGN